MESYAPKLALAGLLFLFSLGSGLRLSRSGKPYKTGIFTLHKLIALATIILIGVNVNALYQPMDGMSVLEMTLVPLTALLFLALFVSGALLSIGKPDNGAVLKVHQGAPLLALLSSAASLYLLVISNM